MIALESHDFDELCRSAAVSSQLETMEDSRSSALRAFWLILAVGTIAAIGATYMLFQSNFQTVAFVAGAAIFFLALPLALAPLSKVTEGLKHPVLEALAAKAGMEYFPSDFAPPLFPEAKKALFGGWISSETFTDLLNGKDERGYGVAVYEALLQRSSGKSRHTVFSGQVYALQQEQQSGAVTVIVPDRGLFNFFKPSGGFDRVRIDDEEFERRFEIYSTHEVSAKQLLFSSDLRRLLLDLGAEGRKAKVFAYLGPEGVLVAVSGTDRFEPGSMFRSTTSHERTKSIFDDFCGSMAVLRRLQKTLL